MTDKINLVPIKKAIESLERALVQKKTEFTRDAAIQRFEYTYELSWKVLKRFLRQYYGIDEGNIKNLYRYAFKNKLIPNVESWSDYHTAHNLTSHTYNEDTAEETFGYLVPFLKDVKALTKKLEAYLDAN